MKYVSLFFAIVGVLFTGCKTEQVPKTGEFKLIDIPSPSLKDAIINPKTTQKVGIYLPPSYQTTDKRYPVVYSLTGFTVEPGEYPPMEWIDSIMVQELVEEMIFVEISGFNIFQGTMYANSPVTGNWEDFVTKDVISYIDSAYRTIPHRDSRGIVGHSMGGGGCFNISLKHPDKYSVAYPMSPAIFSGESFMTALFQTDSTMMFLEDLENKLSGVEKNALQDALEKIVDTLNNEQLWILCNGSAFSPDVTKTLAFSFPFSRSADGSLIKNDSIWMNWAYGFGQPELKIKKYKDNLLKYRCFSLDCGYNDHLTLLKKGIASTIDVFQKEKIPYSMHWYDGDHVNRISDQMANRVMPMMSSYLLK